MCCRFFFFFLKTIKREAPSLVLVPLHLCQPYVIPTYPNHKMKFKDKQSCFQDVVSLVLFEHKVWVHHCQCHKAQLLSECLYNMIYGTLLFFHMSFSIICSFSSAYIFFNSVSYSPLSYSTLPPTLSL